MLLSSLPAVYLLVNGSSSDPSPATKSQPWAPTTTTTHISIAADTYRAITSSATVSTPSLPSLALPPFQYPLQHLSPKIFSRKLFHILAVVLFAPVIELDVMYMSLAFSLSQSFPVCTARCGALNHSMFIYVFINMYMLYLHVI